MPAGKYPTSLKQASTSAGAAAVVGGFMAPPAGSQSAVAKAIAKQLAKNPVIKKLPKFRNPAILAGAAVLALAYELNELAYNIGLNGAPDVKPNTPSMWLLPPAYWDAQYGNCTSELTGWLDHIRFGSLPSLCVGTCAGTTTKPATWVTQIGVTRTSSTTAGGYAASLKDHPGCLGPTVEWARNPWVRWTKKAGQPALIPVRSFAPPGVPYPLEIPMEFPLATPVHAPKPKARPMAPIHPMFEPSNNPDPAKTPKPEFGLGVDPIYDLPVDLPPVTMVDWQTIVRARVRPQPPTVVITAPSPIGRTGPRPRTRVKPGIDGAGDGRGGITARPGRPSMSRPPKKTKQRKSNVVANGGKAWVVLNMATEGIDFAEALWESIPPKYRTPKKHATLRIKLQEVWEHLDKINVAAAFVNVINQNILDQFYAKLGLPTKKLTQELGALTGVDRAINQTEKNLNDWLASEFGPDARLDVVDAVIPHLDFDHDTGEVTLVVPWAGDFVVARDGRSN